MASLGGRAAIAILFFSVALASSAFAGSETPFIVAHKKVSLRRIDPATERVSVSVDVYNQGSVPAYDVSVTDDSWTNIFVNVLGNTSKSWEGLDAGALVSHSFELETRARGIFYGSPALVMYRISAKADLQVAYSNPILPLDILSEKTKESTTHLLKKLVKAYGSQISAISLVILFGYFITTPSKSNAPKNAKKKRN